MNRIPDQLTIRAPASLLLAGEYAILEEGGLGIGVAVECVATLTRVPGEPRITGVFGRESATGGRPTAGVLERASASAADSAGPLESMARSLFGSALPTSIGDVTIDTSSFFDANGKKRGYGSSGAVAVLLASLRHRLDVNGVPDTQTDGDPGATGNELDPGAIFHDAVEAHRAAQRGRGSGYDVACSVFGGLLLFSGGARPTVRRLDLSWMPPLWLLQGRSPVSSADAVSRYRSWQSGNTTQAGRFLEQSNLLVSEICVATSWRDARPLIEEYRELAVQLGGAIGVPADAPVAGTAAPATRDGMPAARIASGKTDGLAKCVGAGDELVVWFGADGKHLAGSERVHVAGKGVAWE